MIMIALHLSPACLAHDLCICGHEETAKMIHEILTVDYPAVAFQRYRALPFRPYRPTAY